MDRIAFFIMGCFSGLLLAYLFHVLFEGRNYLKKQNFILYYQQKLRKDIRLYLVMLLVAAIFGWILISVDENAGTLFKPERSIQNERLNGIYERIRDTGLNERDIQKIKNIIKRSVKDKE